MKILKRVFIFILIVAGIYLIVGAILPAKNIISNSKVIKADKKIVFNLVNDLSHWDLWSPWKEKDTAAIMTYSKNTIGKDAFFEWKGNKEIGEGKITLNEIYGNDSILYTLDFKGQGSSKGSFIFNTKDNGTEVIWNMDGSAPFYLRVMIKLFFEGMLKADFEKGLNNIEKVALSLPKEEPVVIEPEGLQGVQDVPATNYLAYRAKATKDDISIIIGQSYGKIGEIMAKEKLEMAGAPACIYYKNDPKEFEFDAVMAISAEPKGDIKPCTLLKVPAQKALVYNYYGSYMEMFPAYEKMMTHIKDNKLTQNGSPWEVYIGDPGVEKDPKKILTKIYIPVK